MGPAIFRGGYPRLAEFQAFVDPNFSSGLWRRVTGQKHEKDLGRGCGLGHGREMRAGVGATRGQTLSGGTR